MHDALAPLDPGGPRRVLPSLWDAATDRATRAEYEVLPAGGRTVHLWPAAGTAHSSAGQAQQRR